MAYPRRSVRGDEELGKKYDDPLPSRDVPFDSATATLRLLPRRPRRLLFVILGLTVLALFLKNVPSDRFPATERINRTPMPPPLSDVHSPSLPSDNDNGDDDADLDPPLDRSYNGPVQFYSLAKSLQADKRVGVFRKENNVIILAASALESVSSLLPLACELAREEVYRVHFALVGRHSVSIKGIQEVNGINEFECPLVWHDGRPDHGPWSSDIRMEESVKAALGHIARHFHPRVVITHDDAREETYFRRGIKKRVDRMRVTHIGLPYPASSFKWVANLGIEALKAWNKIHIDILVHAPPQSAGGLITLLKSLERADYLTFPPTLTIELPPDADPSLLDFLSTFAWPPNSQRRDFTIRRRIQPQNLTPEEAATRMVDAVYPKHSNYSHVLVLSPHAELAPSFYQYLRYAILKYKHSNTSQKPTGDILGISLQMPSSRPTDDAPFSYSPPSGTDEIPQFLWQVPNSHAALYFGDKWVEFQSFLSNRFSPTLKSKQRRRPDLVSPKYPSWMDYMLEFIRARGYCLLFPAFATEDDLDLVSVHSELRRPPEEYTTTLSSTSTSDQTQDKVFTSDRRLSGDDPLLADEKVLSESPTLSNLLNTFPEHLPNLSSLKVLSYTGETVSPADLADQTEIYRKTFINEIGGCDGGQSPPNAEFLKADDLFCLVDNSDGA